MIYPPKKQKSDELSLLNKVNELKIELIKKRMQKLRSQLKGGIKRYKVNLKWRG
jgi:ribosomal protein L29